MKETSLLYKLIDDQQVPEFYKNIHQDLENLLNTRNSGIFYQEDNSLINASIINYGLRDLFNSPSTTHYKNDFIHILKNTIENFEPRLKNIEISILPNNDPSERTLRFRIIGTLHLNATTTLITLDSTINPENHSLQLSALQDY